MIKLEDLKRIFRSDEVETMALNIRSLEIKKGEFVSMMGPSGCGKSTLLNILGMLDSPTRGSYLFNGKEMNGCSMNQLTDQRKKSIGFVFQNFNLIDELNVYENIELPLLYLDLSSSEIHERITEVLDRMQISHRSRHFPKQLSGGQQQRVAIARAVVTKPDLILADEPTGNLDSVMGREVLNLLKELNDEGTTIVMVTHSNTDTLVSERVINLLDGEIVMELKR